MLNADVRHVHGVPGVLGVVLGGDDAQHLRRNGL